ncbi:MAG: YwbE family protein [Sphingobacteriales bacterium]|nr:MAG: YwbE family protein [Sphingobacteriales bacterium]
MDGRNRADIYPGLEVAIILKKDQRTGKQTTGIVKDLLTSAPYHSRGIKVRLESGEIGRVAEILGDPED